MKTKSNRSKSLTFAVLAVIILFSSAFISKGRPGDGPNDPVKLTYTMTSGKAISYSTSTVMNQAMDINGQTMNVFVTSDMYCKIIMSGKADVNLKLGVTLDSMSMKVESPQGSTGSKIKDVEGKSFNMIISPSGKAVDVSEAAKIEYTVESQGNSNLSQAFSHFFPTLPEKAVKAGDTWITNDTIVTKTNLTRSTQILQNTNKFEGIEKVNGIECARITTTFSGKMETSTNNNGMDIFVNGPMQGQVTLYFAIKEGYILKQDMVSKMTGTVDISGAQAMSFPVIIDITGKLEAKK